MEFAVGTIVQVGDGDVDSSAVGLQYRITEPPDHHGRQRGRVIKDPNGWGRDYVRHRYNPNIDTVITQTTTNKALSKALLDKNY